MEELFNQMQLTIMLFESQAEQFIKKGKEYKIKEIEELKKLKELKGEK